LELEAGEWSASRPGRSLTRENIILFVQEAMCVLGSVWTGAVNLTHTWLRCTDRPARSRSL